MRLSERFELTWEQVEFVRHEMRLSKTKNFSGRSIPMNRTVEAAFKKIKSRTATTKRGEKVFADLLFSMVPGGGLEPPWDCSLRILSPLRLPISPSGLMVGDANPILSNILHDQGWRNESTGRDCG
jgi:hypothetical protein